MYVEPSDSLKVLQEMESAAAEEGGRNDPIRRRISVGRLRIGERVLRLPKLPVEMALVRPLKNRKQDLTF